MKVVSGNKLILSDRSFKKVIYIKKEKQIRDDYRAWAFVQLTVDSLGLCFQLPILPYGCIHCYNHK